MQSVMDAIWEKSESKLQRGDRRHMKERDKRRSRKKRMVWYIIATVLLLVGILYFCLFMK